jgi:hypothetical protein
VVDFGQSYFLRIWGEAYERTRQLILNSIFGLVPVVPHRSPYNLNAITYSTLESDNLILTTQDWLPSPRENADPYILIYALITILQTVCSVIISLMAAWVIVRASRTMFVRTIFRVARAPSRYFDKTPSGNWRIFYADEDLTSSYRSYPQSFLG